MKCPICHDTRMREVEKEDVRIDICPDCKGVWLDRGELEKLMVDIQGDREFYKERRQYEPSKYSDHRPQHQYKKKSVLDRLGDLFD